MTTATSAVHTTVTAYSLRKILLLDALTGLLMGLMLLAMADFLSPLLALPENLLRGAGAALFGFAALVWLISRAGNQAKPPAPLVWLVILANLDWVICSILAIEVWYQASGLGMAFVILQALVVLGFTVFEYRGLRLS